MRTQGGRVQRGHDVAVDCSSTPTQSLKIKDLILIPQRAKAIWWSISIQVDPKQASNNTVLNI